MSSLQTHADSQLLKATVGEAMRRGVIACAPDSPLAVVAATMASHAIHAAAVLSADGDRALAVRDLDVVRASLSGEEAPTALEIACETMPAIPLAAPLADALALMAREDVSHLIVTDPGGNWPLGVISSFDLVAVLAGRSPALARVVRPAAERSLASPTELTATTVGDVMHPGVVHSPPVAPLVELAGTMADLRLHCVAVAGVARRAGGGEHGLWGLVTDMDVIHAAYRGELAVSAAEVAATEPLALAESASLHRAAALMCEHEATHVVAIGRSGLPSGVVSTLDVLRVLAAR